MVNCDRKADHWLFQVSTESLVLQAVKDKEERWKRLHSRSHYHKTFFYVTQSKLECLYFKNMQIDILWENGQIS